MVLATAQGRMDTREGADFFPLTVDVEERMYAAGKIPGAGSSSGRPPDRARHPHRPHDRPPDPAALAEGLPQRGAADLHDPLGRPRDGARHPLHQRGVGRVDGRHRCPFSARSAPCGSASPTASSWSTRPPRRRGGPRALDLIVVGTREALTMVEAGAEEVPEENSRGLRPRPRRDREDLQRAGGTARAGGQANWLDTDLTAELEGPRGPSIRERIEAGTGCGSALRSSTRSRPSSPRADHGVDRGRHHPPQPGAGKPSPWCSSRRASQAVEVPVREQFIDALRALTEAEQDSKELKSAKRALLFDRIVETVQLLFPVGPEPTEIGIAPVKDTMTRQFLKRAAEASRMISSAARSRSRSVAPTAAAPRRSGRSPARSASRRERTAPRSSRAARPRS